MIVKSGKMIHAVETINLVPSRAGIPTSEFIRIEVKGNKLRLRLASEVYAEVYAKGVSDKEGEAWVFYIDRQLLVPWVLRSKEIGSQADFKLSCKSSDKASTLLLRCGRRFAKVRMITPVHGYGEITKDSDGVTLRLSAEQRKLLKLSASYATLDPTYAHLNCVYLKKKSAVLASNSIALFRVDHKDLLTSVPFPLLLLNLFESEHIHGIHVDKKVVRLDMGNGQICQALNARAAQEFPAKTIEAAMKEAEKLPHQFSVKAEKLLGSVKGLETSVGATVKRDLEVSIKGTKGDKFTTLTVEAPQGRFSEVTYLIKPLKRDVKALWLVPLLIPMSEYASSLHKLSVHYDDSTKSPYLFKAGKVRLLIQRKS